MSEVLPQVQCPVHEVPLPDLQAFGPLLERLQANTPVVDDEVFPRGTLRADGRLDLCKQDAGVLGCQAVTEALRNNNAVQSLLLGTNGIGDEGAAHVADLVKVRPLRTVYLGCNLIRAAGAQALADAIRVQPEVRALWLKRNPLGREGAQILAQLLTETSTLRTLDLVHTAIGDEGARAILQALAVGNRSLEYLYLSGNALTSSILPELVAVLEDHPSLKGLYLSVNHLGPAGGQGIAAALKRNMTLEFLGLASCGIGDDGLALLLEATSSHPRLVSLDLGDAPSARTLGASPNQAGSRTAAAALHLLQTPGPLRALNLPRMTDSARLLERVPTQLILRITGAKQGLEGQRLPPMHVDAADIRSVYR